MAKNGKRSLAGLLIKIALACYFVVTGLWVLGLGGSIKGNEVYAAVYGIFNGDFAKILAILVGVLILICGIAIGLSIFVDLGKFSSIIMLVTLIVWVAVAVVADIFSKAYGVSNFDGDALFWILNVAKDLLIIGGILTIRD